MEEQVATWRGRVGRSFLEHLWRESRLWIQQRTVGLFASTESGNPVAHGSGVLLGIADMRFVLSASHVLSTVRKEPGRRLLIGAPGLTEDGFLHEISVVDVYGTPDEVVADFGFIVLERSLADEIAKTKRFLSLAELRVFDREPSDGLYAVVGYPRETTRRNGDLIESPPFYLESTLFDGSLDNYESGISIALNYPRTITDFTGPACRPCCAR